jgi:hypothetical protein
MQVCAKMQPIEIDQFRVRGILLTIVFISVSTSAAENFNSTVVTASASVAATTGQTHLSILSVAGNMIDFSYNHCIHEYLVFKIILRDES